MAPILALGKRQKHAIMIKNYITIALRNIMRNKIFSFITIAGLSISIACCLLLALYIQDEASYDQHHRDVNNLYLLTSIITMPDGENRVMRSTSAPIVWGVKDELPEIETVTRLVNPPGVSQNLIRYKDNQFYERDGFIADSTLFDIFKYEFLSGNPKKALSQANSVVITEALAEKIFGREEPLNKIISINQGGPVADFRVTGVLAAKQDNSHIFANFFVSMTSSGWAENLRSPHIADQWAGQNFMLSYIRLMPGHSPEEFIPKMNKVFLKYGAEDLKALGMKKKLGLQAVKDIHLYATYGDRIPRINYLFVIGSIAVFILLIACINFMNLSTAKATRRANEVGLRKTMGAYRISLIGQFLGEAMIIVLIALVLSLGIAQVLLPVFNELTQKNISFDSGNLSFFFVALVGIACVTGLLSGSYPAFYLSSFQPVKVFKGKISMSGAGSLLRQSLVVFQFMIAITLVCGMFTIIRQLRFMQEKDLGFSTNNKIVLPLRSETVRNNYQVLQSEFINLSSVKSATGSEYVPGSDIFSDFHLYPEGSSKENAVLVRNSWVEPNFMDVLGIKLIAGRKFTDHRDSESHNKVIINRTAAAALGFEPEKIIGQLIYNDGSRGPTTYEVIGVMENYHQVTLKEEIYPVLFRVPQQETNHHFMTVDVNNKNIRSTLSSIEEIWKKVNPDTPFEYTFLDEDIKRQYDEDKRVARIITGFTTIAMIISCLGLYGLSTYIAERRVKEIGVRKVMGASVSQIARMMSGEFIRLVLMAFVIAVPLSWYGITKWLETFAYKTSVGVSIFLMAGAGAMVIALLTVSFESIKAASENPVNALRNE
jgi:putative ABC transport system permease protein